MQLRPKNIVNKCKTICLDTCIELTRSGIAPRTHGSLVEDFGVKITLSELFRSHNSLKFEPRSYLVYFISFFIIVSTLLCSSKQFQCRGEIPIDKSRGGAASLRAKR
jgi:hypothetical protein